MDYTITFSLNEGEIKDILTTAIEGGIGYWACLCNDTSDWENAREKARAKLNDTPCYCDVAYELLADGKAVEFIDEEDNQRLSLTMEKFTKGCQLFTEHRGKSISKLLDDGDFDAEDADMLIQYALYGEVIYG